jgi:hypothetical protein
LHRSPLASFLPSGVIPFIRARMYADRGIVSPANWSRLVRLSLSLGSVVKFKSQGPSRPNAPVFFVLLMALQMFGCSYERAGSVSSFSSPPQVGLPDMSDARAIRIQNDWRGIPGIPPVRAHYALQRSGTEFRGDADYLAAGRSGQALKNTQAIVIPLDRIEGFLGALSKSTLRPGPYRPATPHTDDYPSVRIEIELRQEAIVFFSTSQGNRHVPWAVTFRGEIYVINPDAPAKALDIIGSYLDQVTHTPK